MFQRSPNTQEATRYGQLPLFQPSQDNSGRIIKSSPMVQPSLEQKLYFVLEAAIRPPCPKSLLLDYIWKLPRDAPSAFKTSIFEDHPTRKLPLVKRSVTTIDKVPNLNRTTSPWVEYGMIYGKADNKYGWHCVLTGTAKGELLNTENICTVWTKKYAAELGTMGGDSDKTDTTTWTYSAAAIIHMVGKFQHRVFWASWNNHISAHGILLTSCYYIGIR